VGAKLLMPMTFAASDFRREKMAGRPEQQILHLI